MEKSFYFENIIAWQKAHAFTISVYQITKLFPQELSNQASWFLNAYITGIKNNSGIKD